jgi:hypothetical protein
LPGLAAGLHVRIVASWIGTVVPPSSRKRRRRSLRRGILLRIVDDLRRRNCHHFRRIRVVPRHTERHTEEKADMPVAMPMPAAVPVSTSAAVSMRKCVCANHSQRDEHCNNFQSVHGNLLASGGRLGKSRRQQYQCRLRRPCVKSHDSMARCVQFLLSIARFEYIRNSIAKASSNQPPSLYSNNHEGDRS